MPQSLAFLLVHIVFSTKDRATLLGPEIRPTLHAAFFEPNVFCVAQIGIRFRATVAVVANFGAFIALAQSIHHGFVFPGIQPDAALTIRFPKVREEQPAVFGELLLAGFTQDAEQIADAPDETG